MKDKEMIEEIAQCKNFSGMTCSKCEVRAGCDRYTLAEELYEQGYRKIPKDSVVLSREEYEKLKHFEHRVRSGVCMTQKEWFDFCNEDSNRRTCLRIEEREKERKETAENIIDLIKTFCPDKKFVETITRIIAERLMLK